MIALRVGRVLGNQQIEARRGKFRGLERVCTHPWPSPLFENCSALDLELSKALNATLF